MMETMNTPEKRTYSSTTMNTKRYFIYAVALVLMAACQAEKEAYIEETAPQTTEQKVVAPEITAVQESGNDTKSVLDVDGEGVGTIYWTPADEINVFYGTTSTHYVSQNAVNATTAVFSTSDVIGSTESASENIWGLYPYNSSATCTGSAVTTTLPATQYGVPGTFDEDLFITLAHNTTTALKFYNVCGGIKFSLSRDDITEITFRGNNNEDIAGDISLNFVDGIPNISVTSGVKTITLTPKTGETFDNGVNYYLVLLPVTLSSGFTMSFTTYDGNYGEFNYSSSSITIKRSLFGKKDNIDTYAMLGPVPLNQIWYTSSDGNIVNPYKMDVFGANIISNTYNEGKGVIEFDATITSIGNYAFRNCSKLTSILIPNGVTTLGTQAFRGTGIVSIRIPSSIISLGDGILYQCSSLVSCHLPEGLASLPRNTFYQCSSLTSITLPNSITSIGSYAFNMCSGLSSIIIPNNVKAIDTGAFSGCTGLSSMEIPEGVTSLGSYAFYECTGITSIVIPSTISGQIGNYTFYECSKLTSLSLPSGVTGIGQSAFDRCSELETITIPNTVSSIGDYAFQNCSSLKSIIIPNSVTVIPLWAFASCSQLETVTFPSNLTEVRDYAFYQCSSIRSVTLPATITSIGNSAFRICSSMESFTVYATTPPTTGDYWRYSTGGYIYVPAASVTKYKTAWNTYEYIIRAIE